MARKRALLVGINAYPSSPLRGCVNDVVLMSKILTEQYGFETKEKRMLTDASATTANILERLEWLVDGAQPGDVLYFHYSGHGSQMVDDKYDSDDEPDGLDEIICPVDLDWRDKVVTDDMLKKIFNKVPAGVNLTVMLDSCHSGSMMDQSYQYQPLGEGEARTAEFDDPRTRNRLLPMPADIANRGFGLDLKPKPRSVQSRDVDNTGLLLTGCQSQQTSADAYLDGQYMGAGTCSLAKTLEANNYDVDYKTLVENMNQFMVDTGFSQRPELNGSTKLFGDKFLQPKAAGTYTPTKPPTVTTQAVETVQEVTSTVISKIRKNPIFIAIPIMIAIVGAVIYMGMS